MLVSLYRKVLRRAARSRPRMEPLPPRVLWSFTPVGGEMLVNPGTTGTQVTPDVAISAGGVVAHTWTTAIDAITDPAVAIRDDGNHVVVWAENGDIHAQLKNAAGALVGAEFIATDYTT